MENIITLANDVRATIKEMNGDSVIIFDEKQLNDYTCNAIKSAKADGQLFISKITNHEEIYTMVDVFSTIELAQEFQQKFIDKFFVKGKRWMFDIQIENKPIDSLSYPFLIEK